MFVGVPFLHWSNSTQEPMKPFIVVKFDKALQYLLDFPKQYSNLLKTSFFRMP